MSSSAAVRTVRAPVMSPCASATLPMVAQTRWRTASMCQRKPAATSAACFVSPRSRWISQTTCWMMPFSSMVSVCSSSQARSGTRAMTSSHWPSWKPSSTSAVSICAPKLTLRSFTAQRGRGSEHALRPLDIGEERRFGGDRPQRADLRLSRGRRTEALEVVEELVDRDAVAAQTGRGAGRASSCWPSPQRLRRGASRRGPARRRSARRARCGSGLAAPARVRRAHRRAAPRRRGPHRPGAAHRRCRGC